MFDDSVLNFAIDTVRRASDLVRVVQRELVTESLTKGDKSPVTVGDFAAQALVAQALERAYPESVLVGEEESSLLRNDANTLDLVTKFVARAAPGASSKQVCQWIDRGAADSTADFWTLDPIDGTKGFLRKEQYAVCLARIVEGRVVLGVLGCPNMATDGRQDIGGAGSLFFAVRGKGAFSMPLDGGEPKPIRVSDVSDARQARLLRSVEKGHTNVDQMGDLVKALGAEADPVLMDSQAKYSALAVGSGDALFRLISPDKPNYREKIWDQAAGMILVEEAGGRVTDLSGKPLDFSHGRTLKENRGVVATNGKLHDAALAALRAVGA